MLCKRGQLLLLLLLLSPLFRRGRGWGRSCWGKGDPEEGGDPSLGVMEKLGWKLGPRVLSLAFFCTVRNCVFWALCVAWRPGSALEALEGEERPQLGSPQPGAWLGSFTQRGRRPLGGRWSISCPLSEGRDTGQPSGVPSLKRKTQL